ncbi:acyltransferase [Streptomyces europaeiscabiei]|uniref:acyltransferase family protein n=1 Tax=Streptomyces europaeiscabiei TaxID=146819 RepID=UPI002E16EB45
MPQTSQRVRRLPSLTGLRFLAAFSVFISHAAFFGGTAAGVDLSYLYPLGAMGVSFFFILSGFVLTYSSRENDTTVAFWKRRFFKIFPNHFAVWLGIIAMVHFAGLTRMPPGARITLSDDLSNLFLVDTLIPRMPTGGGNGVAWSLTCEVVFYLLFPLLLPQLRRISAARLTFAAVCCLAAVWIVPLTSLALAGSPAGGPLGQEMSAAQLVFVYFWPIARIPEFALGIILARYHLERPTSSPGLPAAAFLLVVSYTVGLTLADPFQMVAVSALPLALIIVAAAASDSRGRKTPFSTRTGVFLGDISYAFYLIHFTALIAFMQFVGGKYGPLFAVSCALVVSLALSAVLYILVEKPVMRGHTVRARRRHSLVASTPASTS